MYPFFAGRKRHTERFKIRGAAISTKQEPEFCTGDIADRRLMMNQQVRRCKSSLDDLHLLTCDFNRRRRLVYALLQNSGNTKTLLPDSWISYAIQNISNEIAADRRECGEAGCGENHRIVAAENGFECDAAHAGPGKDDFSKECAAHEEGKTEAAE